MSNLPSDQLFRLIKAMSKGEKRFFTLYVSKENDASNKKFVLLFNAIDKQKKYNEPKIIQSNSAFFPHQFSNLKNHLYLQLLKCIKLCNSSKLENLRISELLDYARVLYSKCLYKECVKMIDKVKALAKENDRSILLLEILELEKMVLPKTLEAKNQDRVNALIKTTKTVAESINNINTFSSLALKLNAYYLQTGFIKNKTDEEKLSHFFKSNLPTFKEKNLSFQEKIYLYNSYVGYYLFTQNFNQSYNYAKKCVTIFNLFPEMQKHKLELYIRALNNLLVSQNKLYKYKEFAETQKQLIAIKRNKKLILTENINLNLFKAIYVHEINRHFMLGDFKSGTRIVAALEGELNKFIPKLDKHAILLFYYKIACLYIGNGNIKTALKWLNKIYNEKEIDLRSDIHSFTRILLLVCHFELNHEDLLESTIRSTYRYFRKKGELTKYQNYILNFIRYLFNNPTDRNLKRQFVELKTRLLRLEKNKYEKRAFMYFDIISWLEGKIENRTVQEIIQEKARIKMR